MGQISLRSSSAVLLLLTMAAYANSFRGGWHLDDNHTIVQNESIGDLPGALRSALLSNRGVADLTFTVNWLVAGNDPALYHVVNLLIHLANGILVLFLVRSLSKGRPRGDEIALGVSALFLLHPLATNSITYIVQRYTALATFFYLGSVVLYRHGREGSRRAAILSVVSALLAARTKEIALTIPFALLLVGPSSGEGRKERVVSVLPHLLAVSLIPITLLFGRLGLGESLSEALGRGSRETADLGRWPYLLTQVHAALSYLRLLAAPYGLTLDHDFPVTRALDPATAGRALFLAAVLFAAFRMRRRNPLFAVGVAWFFLTLSVESSVFPIRDVFFEHRTYLPSVGFFLAAVALLERAIPSTRAFAFLLAAASIALGLVTSVRNRVWADEVTLWTDSVRKAPRKPRTAANLGYAWLDRGEKEKAIRALERSVQLGDPFPEDLVTLAELYHESAGGARAEEALRRALEIRPDYGRARRNLAQLLADKGDLAGALRESEETTRREPDYAPGWLLLARLRLDAGDEEGSRAALVEARRRRAEAGETAILEARALAAAGRGEEALRSLTDWRAAGQPGNREDAARVVRSLVDAGDATEAAEAAALAAAVFLDDARFPYYEGAILLGAGRPAEAADALREAVRRAPARAELHSLLARALFESGERDEAVRSATEALRLDPNDRDAADLLAHLAAPRR